MFYKNLAILKPVQSILWGFNSLSLFKSKLNQLENILLIIYYSYFEFAHKRPLAVLFLKIILDIKGIKV